MNDKGNGFASYGIAESSSAWQQLQNKTHRNYRRLLKKNNRRKAA
ncbi:hypothetical protein ACLEUY_16815 [Enterobacter ludwigii]